YYKIWNFEFPNQWAYTSHPTNLVFNIFVIPLIAGFYLWISSAPQVLIANLISSEIFIKVCENQKKELVVFFGSTKKLLNKQWPLIALIFGIMAVPLLVLFNTLGFGLIAQGEHNWVGSIIIFPYLSLTIYMVFMIITKGITTILLIRNLFRSFAITLFPWHPDHCGGLYDINNYALKFTYIIAICGFGLGLLILHSSSADKFFNDFLLWIALGLYIFLAPFCFFGTLGGAHDAMKKEKTMQLKEISDKFNNLYQSARKSLGSKSLNTLKIKVDEIEQLQRLYQLTNDFPIWPFDWLSIRRFSGAILGSLLPFILAILTEHFGKLL
ncbi:MAG: hypothetical protein ACYDG5_05055, partial [Dehalococcoidales bacterium]